MAKTAEIVVYRGACDASAAVRLGRRLFVMANDEDSVLRVYDRDNPGLFVHSVDLSDFLGIEGPEDGEADLEGAARIGSLLYWIGSHGRNNDGTEQKTRRRLFAASVKMSGGTISISPVGKPYKRLLRDFAASPELSALGLGEAVELPPKTKGGLSIEGLAPAANGGLLIGFRNPVPQGKALVVRVHNPKQLVDGAADAAVLSVAGLLDLDGRGIRAIEMTSARTYVIVAGAHDGRPDFGLYRWSGRRKDPPARIETPRLDGLNPEELLLVPSGDSCEIELLSDDSSAMLGGKECKKVKNAGRRTFRGLRFRAPMRNVTG